MTNEQSEGKFPQVTLGVILVGALTLITIEGFFDLWDTLLGIFMLVVLWVYGEKPEFQKGWWKQGHYHLSLGVFSLALVIALAFPILFGVAFYKFDQLEHPSSNDVDEVTKSITLPFYGDNSGANQSSVQQLPTPSISESDPDNTDTEMGSLEGAVKVMSSIASGGETLQLQMTTVGVFFIFFLILEAFTAYRAFLKFRPVAEQKRRNDKSKS